jgi:hypothetical protein
MAFKYKCPACIKVGNTSLDLARHMMGRGDKVHRDWINAHGMSYAELLGMQMRSFGGEGFHKLSALLENEAKVDESVIKISERASSRSQDEGDQQVGT